MTVTSASRKITHAGSGTTGPFSFSFRVLAAADIKVTKVSSAGVRTVLTNPAGYTVTLVSAGLSGGSVTLVSALAVGETLVIEGNLTVTQPSDYANAGSFKPETHETSFDRVTIAVQEVKKNADAALRLPPESALSEVLLPAPEAGKALVWNDDEDAIENSASTLEDVSVVAPTSLTLTRLRQYLPT